MSELKTKPQPGGVPEFLDEIPDANQQADARTLVAMLEEITGQPPVLWGTAILGFDTYRYKYASGREGDWMTIGFAPRKGNTTVYCMDGFGPHEADLEKLGPHKKTKSCLHLKRLSDIDQAVLKRILKRSYANTKAGGGFGAV